MFDYRRVELLKPYKHPFIVHVQVSILISPRQPGQLLGSSGQVGGSLKGLRPRHWAGPQCCGSTSEPWSCLWILGTIGGGPEGLWCGLAAWEKGSRFFTHHRYVLGGRLKSSHVEKKSPHMSVCLAEVYFGTCCRFSSLFNFRFIVFYERLPCGIACCEKICSVLILWRLLSLTSYYLWKFQMGTVLFRE